MWLLVTEESVRYLTKRQTNRFNVQNSMIRRCDWKGVAHTPKSVNEQLKRETEVSGCNQTCPVALHILGSIPAPGQAALVE